MLADTVDVVIGCDTHRDRHALAVIGAATGTRAGLEFEITANDAGYECALARVAGAFPARRVWAIEGTGSYGKGLARYLAGRGEQIIEINRAVRPALRSRPKSDAVDAIQAARTALAQTTHNTPRTGKTREALRVLMIARDAATEIRARGLKQIKALIVTAPDGLRERLRPLPKTALLHACAKLRPTPSDPTEDATRAALRALARAALAATTDQRSLEERITTHLTNAWPGLLEQTGVGPITAAQLVISYSHHDRCNTEAAFARLAGVAPIPASSGNTTRYRLDPGGDRRLNRALHVIAIQRARHDPRTRAYLDRKTSEGKTPREALRCLKRHLARSLYRHLRTIPDPT